MSKEDSSGLSSLLHSLLGVTLLAFVQLFMASVHSVPMPVKYSLKIF